MARRLSLRGRPKELIFAIFLLFALFVIILTLVFAPIIVPGYPLTAGFRVAYNIFTTAVATIIARYTASELQKQWIRSINHDISNAKFQLSRNPTIAGRWRAVLGISAFGENLKNMKSTGLVQLSTLATAMITAACVAAVTLTDTSCSFKVRAPRIHSGADNRCMRNVPNRNIDRLSPLWEFRTFWDFDDGTSYFATTNLGCPSWSGAQNLGAINTINPAEFAYARNGVAVSSTAIGAPEILYTNLPQVVEPIEVQYGRLVLEESLRSVTHCLPIMSFNPVKCRAGGNVDFVSAGPSSDGVAGNNSMTVDAGGCKFSQAASEDPSEPFGVMVSRLCPARNVVGKGTIAIGATGIISLTLAAAMGDAAFLAANADKYDGLRNRTISGLEYAVSCSIDVRPTIRWRTLSFKLQQGTLKSDGVPSYSKIVSGVEGCPAPKNASAKDWNLGDGYAGGAVAALVPPLSEGRYWNGMTNTILNQALNVTDTSDRYSTVSSWQHLIRSKPYGFKESTNALEDVLGLTAGITMSQMSTLDSQSQGSPLTDPENFHSPVLGNATFACTRVGSGNYSALLFTIPPLLALSIAIYLLIVVPTQRTQYKTSRLEDLISIGMASERELHMAYKADHQRESASSATSTHSGMSTLAEGRSQTPSGWSQRWVTDASGTRAIPVKLYEGSENGADASWTTGLPKSPVRQRHDP